VIEVVNAAGFAKPDVSILPELHVAEVREQARASIRVIIKRILRKYGYPPDLKSEAAQLVLQQAEVLCDAWMQRRPRYAHRAGCDFQGG
jgi:hypothetical protein